MENCLIDTHVYCFLYLDIVICVFLFQYIFTDIINNYTFTTKDYGKTFRTLSVPFRPKTIQIHPSNPNVVLGMDEEEPRKRVGNSVLIVRYCRFKYFCWYMYQFS